MRELQNNIRERFVDGSRDGEAPGPAPNGKPIATAQEAADNLHRSGYDWYFDQYGEAADGVINYGFWETQAQVDASYHRSQTGFGYVVPYGQPGYFQPFTAAQIAAAELAIGLWDDLIALDFQRTAVEESDINYMNTFMSPAAGAGAFQPGQINGYDAYYEQFGIHEVGRLGGDVFVNRLETANFDPAVAGAYSLQTLLHETGHALGFDHVGDYNASDDEDGIPGPDPITYQNDAFIFQDSHQYSLMSYFGSRETGAATYDFANLEYLYPATPMVHDIKAIQDIYGAETTTRTGNTVYGFNSNTDRPAIYDFNVNKLPVLCIWDSAGNDTLDFSGWNSNSVIDLTPGSFSSGGGSGRPTLAKYQEVFGDPDATEADVDAYLALRNSPDGMLRDNVSIAYGAIIENAIGGGGNDLIRGNAVANKLVGNGGNDTIYTGDGLDVAILGGGNDIFVAEFGASKVMLKGPQKGSMSVDIITDFDAAGDDRIDLSALGDFAFKGTNANKNAGDVTYKTYDSINGAESALGIDIDGRPGASGVGGKVTVVYLNDDHGGAPDAAIILLNTSSVDASDFIF